jgi:hypothetical protein
MPSNIDRTLIGDETDTPDHNLDALLKRCLDGDKDAVRQVAKFYRPELTDAQADVIAERFSSANLAALLQHAEACPTCAGCNQHYPYEEKVRWPTLCRGCTAKRLRTHKPLEQEDVA